MRFRSTVNKDHFAALYGQIKQMHDLGKDAIITLSAGSVRCCLKGTDESFKVFSSLTVSRVFSDFRIESKHGNVIGIEVHLPNLLHALKSSNEALSTTIKLTKQGSSPFLSTISQMVDGGINVQQDVPIRVLSAPELESYTEPAVPTPPVRLRFSSFKAFASVVDRQKTLAKRARIDASMETGQIVLSVTADTVEMRTFFRGLQQEPLAEGMDAGLPLGPDVTAHLPCKTLAKAMKSISSSTCKDMLLCIAPENCVILHVENEERSTALTFMLSLVDDGGVRA